MAPRPTYVVAQMGARRNYAVPAMLASAGMLSHFYTDICGNVGLGHVARVARRVSLTAERLANRRVPDAVKRHTRTFPVSTVVQAVRTRIGANRPEARFRAQLRWQHSLAADERALERASHVYSMHGEFPGIVRAARQRGLRVVSEVYITPSADAIVSAERQEFPGWEPGDCDFDGVRMEFDADAQLAASDLFLCPSESVAQDLIARHRVSPDRTRVVPYGVADAWFAVQPRPVRGRVLFAGSAGLRKGVHYLAMAAELLPHERGLEFRVAGDVSASVVTQPVCRRLTFLGRVHRAEMRDEMARADVFVLPTLAEGSAEVIYEAMAVGVPVITTPAAGSVVRDRIDGSIVPARDAAALARAIQELTGDRQTRDRMSAAARQRAAEYTWTRYSERLLEQLVDA